MNKFVPMLIVCLMLPLPALSDQTGTVSVELPPPGFEVDQTRSDPDRPVRANGKKFRGPIIDTHAHLYPPSGRNVADARIDKRELKKIIEMMKKLGVETVNFMPTPNDGIRPHQDRDETQQVEKS